MTILAQTPIASDYEQANAYYAMIDYMTECFSKADSLRIEAYYLSFDRYNSHKVSSLLDKADKYQEIAYLYMHDIDSYHR